MNKNYKFIQISLIATLIASGLVGCSSKKDDNVGNLNVDENKQEVAQSNTNDENKSNNTVEQDEKARQNRANTQMNVEPINIQRDKLPEQDIIRDVVESSLLFRDKNVDDSSIKDVTLNTLNEGTDALKGYMLQSTATAGLESVQPIINKYFYSTHKHTGNLAMVLAKDGKIDGDSLKITNYKDSTKDTYEFVVNLVSANGEVLAVISGYTYPTLNQIQLKNLAFTKLGLDTLNQYKKEASGGE